MRRFDERIVLDVAALGRKSAGCPDVGGDGARGRPFASAKLAFVKAGQRASPLAIDKFGLFGIGLRDLSRAASARLRLS